MTRELAVTPLRRPLAVSLYFACHAVAALVLALPTTAIVAGTGLGRFPEGDRLLFQPGGAIAAEVVRTLMPALPAHFLSSFSVAALLGMLLLVPHAALLVGLARTEREPLSATWGRALGHLPPLLALSGIALLAQATVLAGTLTCAGALRGAWLGPTTRSADLVYFGTVLVGSLLALALGVVRDLGRAAIVRAELDSKSALFSGLRAFARAPGRVLAGWIVPALAGAALIALAAALTTLLDVSRPGTWRLGLVALVHQSVAYALCWCRAYWLRASLGLVGVEPKP
ncbi:MAG TPA: hypothetical protein VMS65_10490 [Polyangiaceae bacterium]|nr:hypothetical protein [Polyangiaceae bacterium]